MVCRAVVLYVDRLVGNVCVKKSDGMHEEN